MAETVVVTCMSQSLNGMVERAVAILNRSQTRFQFQLAASSSPLPAPDEESVYSWKLLQSTLALEKERLQATYLFGVLDQPIESNWFSRTFPKDRLCFITTKDWEYLSDLPLVAFVAYEVTENLVEMLLGETLFHDETRGCLHDLCVNKPNISFKIRTADICNECRGVLNARLEPAIVTATIAILEEVRRVALGRVTEPVMGLSLPEIVDRQFPFPVAYCFRSMQAELSYSRKWLKLTELYAVIIRYVSFAHLAALRAHGEPMHLPMVATLGKPGGASDGDWVTACFALCAAAREAPSTYFLARHFSGLTRNRIRDTRRAADSLVEARNRTRGHGWVEEEAGYQELYEQYVGQIDTLLQFLAPLAEFSLIKPTGGHQRRRGVSSFPAKVLMGSHPLFPIQQHVTRKEIDTDCLLYDPELRVYVSLHPWVVLEHCPQCYREVVFLYDKIDNDHVEMREYPTNHRQVRTDFYTEVQEQIGGPKAQDCG